MKIFSFSLPEWVVDAARDMAHTNNQTLSNFVAQALAEKAGAPPPATLTPLRRRPAPVLSFSGAVWPDAHPPTKLTERFFLGGHTGPTLVRLATQERITISRAAEIVLRSYFGLPPPTWCPPRGRPCNGDIRERYAKLRLTTDVWDRLYEGGPQNAHQALINACTAYNVLL